MKYSIITINYNNHEGLLKTIKSVISQTCHDYEYIVIDGGSSDGSREIIEQYADHFSYWVSEQDKGIYNAMNKGIRQAHGEYLLFLNSGDLLYNDKVLEDVRHYLGSDIVHGKIYNQSKNAFPYLIDHEPTMAYLYESSLQHPASFFRKELFRDSLYDESYRIVSDWKFYIEKIVFQNCSFSFIPVTVAVFEGEGVSEMQKELDSAERKAVLNSFLPPRILQDYEHFKGKESPMLELIPQFNHTYRLEKFILWTVKAILKIYHLFKPTRL